MALSLTTSTTLLSQSNISSPYNISSTFDSGSDASGKILIVLVHTVSSAAPTGATYNGTSLTKLQDTGEYSTSAFTQLFYLVDPADGSNTLVVTGGAGVFGMDIDVQVWTGADETTPFGASDALLVSSTTGDTESISVTNGDVIISMAGIRLFWASNIEPNSGQTERIDNNTYSGNYANSSYEAISSTGSENHGYNWSGGVADDAGWVYGVLQPTSASVEQEGFAFGDDDGNEASHTLDTQDTNVTEPVGVKTLRTLLNATGDPATAAYKLKYQKNGAGGYSDVPIVSSSGGSSLVIADTDTYKDGNNTTSTSITITLPSFSAGDLVIICYNLWNNTGTPTTSWASGPDGETVTDLINGYGPSGSGGMQICIGYFIATAGYAGGTMANTSSVATRWGAAIVVVPSGEYDATTPISTAVSYANSASDVTDLDMPTFSAGASDGGGKLLAFVASDQDPFNATMPSGYTALEIDDYGRAAILLAGRDAAVTNSESIAAATFDLNSTAADAMAVYAFIVRTAPATNNEIYVSASSNVAAGGEATTARLTAPSGKTTGDFDTGRRWDDENGSDSVDITTDNYTELEWVLTTQDPAEVSDYYEFRVYNADDALNTYTLTPKWTIGTVSSAIKKYASVALASIKKIDGVVIASVKKVMGVANS